MKKGIVMDINDAFLTLLTPEGEFLRARKQDQPYTIGEEIHFFPIVYGKTSKSIHSLKNIFKVKSVWALMAALVILIGSFIPIYQNNKAYAYMSIDVNPSIELGVNKNMQVVELTGFNIDGKKIISQLDDWRKKDVSELTEDILKELKIDGYLMAKAQVIISTVRTKEPDEKIEKKLQENIEAIKTTVASQQLELTVLTGTKKEREKAQQLGMTTGKYQENKIQATNNQKNKDKEEDKDKDKDIDKDKDKDKEEDKDKDVDKVNDKDKDEDKANEKKQDSIAIPQQPADRVPPGQLKKQTENSIDENIKQKEINRSDQLSRPPGQLKKMEEEQVKQNQWQQRGQFYKEEKVNENKKSKLNEKSVEKQHNNDKNK